MTNTEEILVDEDQMRIRQLNDTLRRTGRGGQVLITNGLGSLDQEAISAILKAVADFDQFNEHNDPYGEHDCAILTVAGERILFKIDYFDQTKTRHSPDPADSNLTVRVMTVMLAREY